MLVLVCFMTVADCWHVTGSDPRATHLHTVVGHVKTKIIPSPDSAQSTELTPPGVMRN